VVCYWSYYSFSHPRLTCYIDASPKTTHLTHLTRLKLTWCRHAQRLLLIEIDAPTSSISSSGNGTALSNAVLPREREVERQTRLQHGNTPPRLGSKKSHGQANQRAMCQTCDRARRSPPKGSLQRLAIASAVMMISLHFGSMNHYNKL
jgi:hypothetical protein